jgi:hypothetical protein
MKHEVIDQRSLAMAKIIARRLRANPQLIDAALANLNRWLNSCSPNTRPALLEWKEIINAGMEQALGVLCGEDERSIRLRQSSPFAGEEFITRAERTDLILRFADYKPA